MDEFSKFMNDRASKIERGQMNVPPFTAQFNQLPKNRQSVITAALEQQKADKSDPFIFTRTVSHLLNGVNKVSDYEHDMGKEAGYGAVPPHHPIKVNVPMHRKIPCI
jgi:hypothetical protein